MDRELELRKRRGTRVLLVVLAIWGLAVAFAAEAGFYRVIPPLFLAAIIALGIMVPIIIYATSRGFRAYIEAIGLRSITAFHIWRIAAALVFFWYGAHNLLPEAFVRNAGWGDLIAGFLALGVLLLPESRNRYLAFHIFGFADFVVAVGTGLTFFLLNDPRMSGIQTLPMALIPLYGVGISGASHIMAFDLLRRGSRSEVKRAAVQT
ncbi:permease [Bradyrhizobium neotropicale]|uniref:permease n=1 Tax=Bradyrhizobium neotropicale TaxID=1497615 RepID=UPI001AD7E072|nr:permease [Bradyrhizobium neotropicale]MBO4227281.1 permease [Bradyrhizobium neotropicale]